MIKKILNENARKTDIFLKKYLDKQTFSDLISPMKYGSLSGGKKIRSSVVLGTGKLFNINPVKLLNICAAVECIHSYSLIHDDLPCMDDDKIRRGKSATHIKFGESTAILAGNSLLTLAFEMIVDKNYKIKNKAKTIASPPIRGTAATCAAWIACRSWRLFFITCLEKTIMKQQINSELTNTISPVKID